MSIIYKGLNPKHHYGLCILTKDGELITANGKHFQAIQIHTTHGPVQGRLINEFEQKFSELKTVQPMKYELEKSYRPNREVQILMKDRDVSQADIMQVHKFECVGSPKERVLFAIINAMLTNSSIGLFNTLREKEHLAYSVHADADIIGDCGEISCHILTTTDNKDIGEYSYDNIQKSRHQSYVALSLELKDVTAWNSKLK